MFILSLHTSCILFLIQPFLQQILHMSPIYLGHVIYGRGCNSFWTTHMYLNIEITYIHNHLLYIYTKDVEIFAKSWQKTSTFGGSYGFRQIKYIMNWECIKVYIGACKLNKIKFTLRAEKNQERPQISCTPNMDSRYSMYINVLAYELVDKGHNARRTHPQETLSHEKIL